MALLSATLYSVLGLVKLATHRASTFDMVIFDQTVRAYSRFAPPEVPVVGAFRGRGLDYLQLADHFSPVWAVLAPVYWVHDGPAALIIAQALLFAAAIPFVWRYTRRVLGTAPAYLLSAAYALSWPVTQAVNFDVHEVMFVPLLTAILLERHQVKKFVPVYLALAGLLLVKEDMGLLVIGFGLYLLLTGDRLHALSVTGLGLMGIGLTRGFLIPGAGGDPADYWAYGHLGANAGEALTTIVTNPLGALHLLVSEQVKIDTLVLLLWLSLLLCLLSPLFVMAVPLILERMLSDHPLWWEADFQYNAYLVVVLLLAGVDGLARLLRRVKREKDASLMLLWSGAVLAVVLAQLPRFALDQLADPGFYRGDQVMSSAIEAAARVVPDGVTVSAANVIGPELTRRATVLLWMPGGHQADWVVADTLRWNFPFDSVEHQAKEAEQLVAAGYRKVFEQDGVVVLTRR